MARAFGRFNRRGGRSYGGMRRRFNKFSTSRRRPMIGKRRSGGYYKGGIRQEIKYLDYDAVAASLVNNLLPEYPGMMALMQFPVIAPGTGTATSQPGAANSIHLLNAVAPGTDIINRIGRKIAIKSLYMKFQFVASHNLWATAGTDYEDPNTEYATTARVLVVYDTQMNSSFLSSSWYFQLVLAVTAAADGTGTGWGNTAHLNLDNRDRFKVITDKLINLDNLNGRSANYLKIYKKFVKPLDVTFSVAGAGGTISTGGIVALVCGGFAANASTQAANGGAVTSSPPSTTQGANWLWDLASRIRFTDS